MGGLKVWRASRIVDVAEHEGELILTTFGRHGIYRSWRGAPIKISVEGGGARVLMTKRLWGHRLDKQRIRLVNEDQSPFLSDEPADSSMGLLRLNLGMELWCKGWLMPIGVQISIDIAVICLTVYLGRLRPVTVVGSVAAGAFLGIPTVGLLRRRFDHSLPTPMEERIQQY